MGCSGSAAKAERASIEPNPAAERYGKYQEYSLKRKLSIRSKMRWKIPKHVVAPVEVADDVGVRSFYSMRDSPASSFTGSVEGFHSNSETSVCCASLLDDFMRSVEIQPEQLCQRVLELRTDMDKGEVSDICFSDFRV